jgi:hypothetical protein
MSNDDKNTDMRKQLMLWGMGYNGTGEGRG